MEIHPFVVPALHDSSVKDRVSKAEAPKDLRLTSVVVRVRKLIPVRVAPLVVLGTDLLVRAGTAVPAHLMASGTALLNVGHESPSLVSVRRLTFRIVAVDCLVVDDLVVYRETYPLTHRFSSVAGCGTSRQFVDRVFPVGLPAVATHRWARRTSRPSGSCPAGRCGAGAPRPTRLPACSSRSRSRRSRGASGRTCP